MDRGRSLAALHGGTGGPWGSVRRPTGRLRVVRPILLAILLLLPAPALACGQTTHVWVSLEALQHLPEGPIADLLSDPELKNILVNGTMFPDGGYAVSDNYGEMAHWEPLQQAYLAWIRDEFGGVYDSLEAKQHIAFLLGMASHGMSDEVFDSLFYELSQAYDPGHDEVVTSLDTASDVTFAADVGGIPQPTSWAPFEVLASVYRDDLGYDVAVSTLESGHSFLYTALAFTDWARTSEERLETFTAEFPWAAARMNNADVPGSPPRQAPIVAAYWQEMWQRLNADLDFDEPVIAMEPPSGSFGHATDHAMVEARIQLTFGRGVDGATFDRITVADGDGELADVAVDHFYGDMSHAVLLRPQEDWRADTEYTVRVDAGLLNFDGEASTTAFEGSFSTAPAPVDEVPDEVPEGADDEGCECSAAPGAALSPLMFLAWRRERC